MTKDLKTGIVVVITCLIIGFFAGFVYGKNYMIGYDDMANSVLGNTAISR